GAPPRAATRPAAERSSRSGFQPPDAEGGPKPPSSHAARRVRLLPAGLALDRRLRADADLDAARLGLLGLRHVDLEHAVLVVGVDRVLRNALRQADRPNERPVPALEAVEALAPPLARPLPPSRHGQRDAFRLDPDP